MWNTSNPSARPMRLHSLENFSTGCRSNPSCTDGYFIGGARAAIVEMDSQGFHYHGLTMCSMSKNMLKAIAVITIDLCTLVRVTQSPRMDK